MIMPKAVLDLEAATDLKSTTARIGRLGIEHEDVVGSRCSNHTCLCVELR